MSKLKPKYLTVFISVFLFLNISCNKSSQSSETTFEEKNSKEFIVSAKDINQLKFTEFALSDLSEKYTIDWLKFQELQVEISSLKKGNISFFSDDTAILKAFITDLKNEVPETINIPSILVRLSVLETTIFKLESIVNLHNIKKELLLNAIKEVLVANSNVILQMNKKFEKDSQKIEKPK